MLGCRLPELAIYRSSIGFVTSQDPKMSQDDLGANPCGPDDSTDGAEQPRRTESVSMDQLQSMIMSSIQAALPSLENAIAVKVAQSLQARGKPLYIYIYIYIYING